jgi:hypothetical protein
MANQYKSSAVLKNSRARPDSQYEAEEATFSVSLPKNTVLGIGDTLAFCILGENIAVTQFSLQMPAIDTNATATLAGRLGTVTYAGAGATQTWTGSQDAVFIAAATVLQTNTTGLKNFARLDGEGTAIDSFAVTPYAVQTDQRIVVLTISAVAATNNLTVAGQTVNLLVKYQYAYPDTYVNGVTGVSSTNLLGTKSTDNAVVYLYGPGATPNAP